MWESVEKILLKLERENFIDILDLLKSGEFAALLKFKSQNLDLGMLWTMIHVDWIANQVSEDKEHITNLLLFGSTRRSINECVKYDFLKLKKGKPRLTPKGQAVVDSMVAFGNQNVGELFGLNYKNYFSAYNLIVMAYNYHAIANNFQREPRLRLPRDFKHSTVYDQFRNDKMVAQNFHTSDYFTVPKIKNTPKLSSKDVSFLSSLRVLDPVCHNQLLLINGVVPFRSISREDDVWPKSFENSMKKEFKESGSRKFDYLLGRFIAIPDDKHRNIYDSRELMKRKQERAKEENLGYEENLDKLGKWALREDIQSVESGDTEMLETPQMIEMTEFKVLENPLKTIRKMWWCHRNKDLTGKLRNLKERRIVEEMEASQKSLDDGLLLLANAETRVKENFKPEPTDISFWTEVNQRQQNDLYWMNTTAFWLNPHGPLAPETPAPEWWTAPAYTGQLAIDIENDRKISLIEASLKSIEVDRPVENSEPSHGMKVVPATLQEIVDDQLENYYTNGDHFCELEGDDYLNFYLPIAKNIIDKKAKSFQYKKDWVTHLSYEPESDAIISADEFEKRWINIHQSVDLLVEWIITGKIHAKMQSGSTGVIGVWLTTSYDRINFTQQLTKYHGLMEYPKETSWKIVAAIEFAIEQRGKVNFR